MIRVDSLERFYPVGSFYNSPDDLLYLEPDSGDPFFTTVTSQSGMELTCVAGGATASQTGYIADVFRTEGSFDQVNIQLYDAGTPQVNGTYFYAGSTGTDGPVFVQSNGYYISFVSGSWRVSDPASVIQYTYSPPTQTADFPPSIGGLEGNPCFPWSDSDAGSSPAPCQRGSSTHSLRSRAVDMDLVGDLQFPLTYQIIDVRQPQNRKSDFSKTITLPGTDNNSRILAQLFEIGADSTFNTNRKKGVFVLQDGVQIFEGVVRVSNINRNDYNEVTYDVSIQGKLSNIFDDLKNAAGGDLLLSDLDLSEYDHLYSNGNITGSWLGQIYAAGTGPTQTYTLGPSAVVTDTVFAEYQRTSFELSTSAAFVAGDVVFFEPDDASIFPSSRGHWTVTDVPGPTSVVVNLPFESTATNSGVLTKYRSNGVGYVYPTVNYGKGPSSLMSWNTSDYRPGVYAREYLQKIFELTGYTYESEFIGSDYFSRMVVLPSATTDIFTETGATGATGATGVNYYLSTSTDQPYDFTRSGQIAIGQIVGGAVGYTGDYLSYTTVNGVPTVFTPGAFTTPNFFTSSAPGDFKGTCTVTIRLDVNNVYNSGTSTNPRLRQMRIIPDLQIIRFNGLNNSIVGSNYGNSWTNPSDFTNPVTFGTNTSIPLGSFSVQMDPTFYPTSSGFTYATGLGYRFQYFDGLQWVPPTNNMFCVVDESGVEDYVTADITLVVEVAVFGEIGNGAQTVSMNKTVPRDFKARDFLTTLISMFNLYLEPSRTIERHLVIEPYHLYYQREALDWTEKVDLSESIDIQPIASSMSKTFDYQYTQDKDKYNADYELLTDESYGARSVIRETEFNSATTVTKPYVSPTVSVDMLQNGFVIPTITKPGDVIVPTEGFRPRILYWTGVKYHVDYELVDLFTSYYYYGYAGNTDFPIDPYLDVNFGENPLNYYGQSGYRNTENNLYGGFYEDYIDELTSRDSRLVTMSMKLKPTDLHDLSFRKLYYVDDVLYRLQKIADYDPLKADPCRVELIKVKEAAAGIPGPCCQGPDCFDTTWSGDWFYNPTNTDSRVSLAFTQTLQAIIGVSGPPTDPALEIPGSKVANTGDDLLWVWNGATWDPTGPSVPFWWDQSTGTWIEFLAGAWVLPPTDPLPLAIGSTSGLVWTGYDSGLPSNQISALISMDGLSGVCDGCVIAGGPVTVRFDVEDYAAGSLLCAMSGFDPLIVTANGTYTMAIAGPVESFYAFLFEGQDGFEGRVTNYEIFCE